MVFEICFQDERQWERFRGLPAVCAALDSVPDPVSGLLICRGRGGTAGTRTPRWPRPVPDAEAIALPEPQVMMRLDLAGISEQAEVHSSTAEE